MSRLFVLVLGLWCIPAALPAQTRCWVYFTDRSGAVPGTVSDETCAARRAQGLPVIQETDAFPSASYCEAVQTLVRQPICVRSRWLNAVSVEADRVEQERLARLPFVQAVVPVAHLVAASAASDSAPALDKGFNQIGGRWAAQEGLTGKGVQIGLIDAGFLDADKAETFRTLFASGHIRAVRDFENPDHTDFFRKSGNQVDEHGASVLTLIAGQQPGGMRFGGATGASFCLARTDNYAREYRHEEDLWLNAMEWMDSLGVRLINSSLGYALGYTDPKENHSPTDIDGHTSAATRAVNTAVEEKGITVVLSAGNDGGNPAWRFISMPADARGAISVGATYYQGWQKVGYSGIGPESLPYLKPDVAAFSLFGTSFSAPVITGGVACLMQKYPNLKPAQYADALRQSAHLQGAPNNYLGYGVPDLHRAAEVLAGQPHPVPTHKLKARGQAIIPVPPGGQSAAIFFHKKDARHVLKQGSLNASEGRFTLARLPEAVITTLATPDQVWEIEWE